MFASVCGGIATRAKEEGIAGTVNTVEDTKTYFEEMFQRFRMSRRWHHRERDVIELHRQMVTMARLGRVDAYLT